MTVDIESEGAKRYKAIIESAKVFAGDRPYGTEHLLLGILSTGDPVQPGPARYTLESLGVTFNAVDDLIKNSGGTYSELSPSHREDCSPQAQRVHAEAQDHASGSGKRLDDAELLAALCLSDNGNSDSAALRILTELGAPEEDVCLALWKVVASNGIADQIRTLAANLAIAGKDLRADPKNLLHVATRLEELSRELEELTDQASHRAGVNRPDKSTTDKAPAARAEPAARADGLTPPLARPNVVPSQPTAPRPDGLVPPLKSHPPQRDR